MVKSKKIILDKFLQENNTFDKNQSNFINSELKDCKLLEFQVVKNKMYY